MTAVAATSPAKAAPKPASALLQRSCACGQGASALTGICDDCGRAKVLGLQARLLIGASDDPMELEADRAAAHVLAMRDPPAAISGGSSPVLSRTGAGAADGGGLEAPPSVLQTLAAPGDPLQASVRRHFSTRFGHDFGSVRVHRDSAAARSTQEVQARAYAVGQHIVFGAGLYAPESGAGRALIAHELAHVVQQGAAPATPVVRRRGFFEQLAGLFAGDTFDEPTLEAYLDGLRRRQRIEDFTDSDNKARAVADAWKEGDSRFVLTQDLKALLIQEMLSGFTGDDDERAILELLERSYNFELAHIFGAGGVTVDALNRAFQGDEQDCLDDFFRRRFVGGSAALAGGTVQPRGDAIPFGDSVPTRCALPTTGLPGFGVSWSMPCVLGILCSEDQQVVHDLVRFDVRSVSSIDVERWEYDGSTWSVADTRHPAGAANADASPPEVKLLRDRNCDQAAQTLVHEVRHQNQPAGSRLSRERDAYIFAEQWSIDRGLPGFSNRLRTTDLASRATVVDTAAVDAYVQSRYPGTANASETIVGHRSGDDHTEISPVDGTNFFRPPQTGDSHWGEPVFNGPRVIGPSEWACPGERSRPELPADLIRPDFNDRMLESASEL